MHVHSKHTHDAGRTVSAQRDDREFWLPHEGLSLVYGLEMYLTISERKTSLEYRKLDPFHYVGGIRTKNPCILAHTHCMRKHVHACMCRYLCMNFHAYTHIGMYVCMFVRMAARFHMHISCINTCQYAYMHVNSCTNTYTYTHVRVCACSGCTYACMYVSYGCLPHNEKGSNLRYSRDVFQNFSSTSLIHTQEKDLHAAAKTPGRRVER